MKRPAPEPFHPPVGLSDEGFPLRRLWLVLGLTVVAVIVAGIVAALRL